MVTAALAIVGLMIGVPLGVYGRWAGWGFGLGWWGRPTPARIIDVGPLTGARMKGGAEWAVAEASHRVVAVVEIDPEDGEPYQAPTVTWQRSGESLEGRTVMVRVSRTRPTRVYLPRDPTDAPEPDGRY